ncbi:TonB-dependent receptor domain-containing protein [Allopusillimonas ginsengisoli]|uniref:TonB-dependent receptor domain-containing protein n=1 Tax=Allopusillimonas ginsengisoli TaxID=453575 RepID=UPI001020EEC8|nr:TonB-dependent receptor [Allopusillimonas ginsengisoli]TEA78779.1 TonB-dependent receptor [Allopusillimonas ginsengisoli]
MKSHCSFTAAQRCGRRRSTVRTGKLFKRHPMVTLISSTFVSMAMLSSAYGQVSQPKNNRKDSSPTPVAADGVFTLGTISVAERGRLNPVDVPYRTAGSSTYLSGEQIERFRGTSVGDFLTGIPGVMNGDSRNSGAVDVNIRGMQGQGRVPFIVDGATQETAIWQGYNGATPRSYIDPDFISSVSIEKGLSSKADATGATGGVVRASTLVVQDILLPGEWYGIRLKGGLNTNSSPVPEPGTDGGWDWWRASGRDRDGQPFPLHTAFDSEGLSRPALFKPTGGSGSIAVAAVTDYLDLVAAYARRKNGNYHAGTRGGGPPSVISTTSEYGATRLENLGLSEYMAGEEILNTSFDNTSWMVKATAKLGADRTLELGIRNYESDYGTMLSSRLWGRPYQSWLSSVDLDTYTARFRWKPLDQDVIDLSIDAYQTVIDNRINAMDLVRQRQVGDPSHTVVGKNIGPFFQWIGSKRRGITAANTSQVLTALGGLTINLGGTFVREDTGFPKGVDGDWFIARYEFNYPREGWREEVSGFTGLEWKPIDRLAINASARYSKFVTKDAANFGNPSFKRGDTGWSPMATVMVEPLGGLQLYTKYGRVIRAPSIFESLAGTSFYYAVDQNPVHFEKARNLEIGLNYFKNSFLMNGDKLRFHAAYFDNYIDGYLTRAALPFASVTRRGTRIVSVLGRVNLDFAKMRGFELSAEYDTGKYFGGLAWNHYTQIMFCAPPGVLHGNDPLCSRGGLAHSYSLQQIPPRNTVTANIGARLLERKLTVGSRANYVGSRFAESIGKNIGSGGVQPSLWRPYLLVDAYASYKLNKHTTFDVAVDNVTDRYYMDAINAALMPAPGRTIRGSVTVKF